MKAITELKFSELDFENSIIRLEEDMAKGLGVPYVLLSSGNNANIRVNQQLFFELTVLPILEQFCSAFEHYWSGLSIIPDTLAVPVLQPDLKAQATRISTLVNGGILLGNEARIELGYDPIDEESMNKIRIPQNITGSATDPSQGGRPEEGDNNK